MKLNIVYGHPDEIKRLDYRGNFLFSEPNPYLILPFIPIFDRQPTSDFWLPGGDDIVCLQESVNEKLTDLLYVVRFPRLWGWLDQGHGYGELANGQPCSRPRRVG